MTDYISGRNVITCEALNRAGTAIGVGPIDTCLSLSYVRRLNGAGEFTAVFPASDPATLDIAVKSRLLRFYVESRPEFVGLVEATEIGADNTGALTLTVRGRDLLGELAEAPVGFLELTDSNGAIDNGPSRILAAANAFGGTAWTLDSALGYGATATQHYASFAGESALEALVKLADHIGEHFRLGSGRSLVWLRTDTPDSGVRCIQTAGEPAQAARNPNVCFIQSFAARADGYDLITRIYPYGAGHGGTRLTLQAATNAPGAGYTLNKAQNYVQSDAAYSAYGKHIGRYVEYKEIRPLSNTKPDLQAAANALLDAAVADLKRRDSAGDVTTYDLSVVGLPAGVQPGQTARVIYQDHRYSLDADMAVLEIESAINSSGARDSRLTVAPVIRGPVTDSSAILSEMARGRVFSAHPQSTGSAYWVAHKTYVGEDPVTERGDAPLILGPEVERVQRILMRVRVGPVVAFATQISGTETTSGASSASTTESGGGSTETSSGGSSHSHSVSVPDHSHSIAIYDITPSSPSHKDLYFDISNDIFVVGNANTGNADYAGTTESGGSTTETTESEDEHTHTVTVPAHSHGMEHTHTVTANLETTYGIYTAPNHLAASEIEWSINGTDWTAIDAGEVKGSYYQHDLTALVSDEVFRPTAEDFTIQFRAAADYTPDRTAMLDVLLGVSAVIQTVAYN